MKKYEIKWQCDQCGITVTTSTGIEIPTNWGALKARHTDGTYSGLAEFCSKRCFGEWLDGHRDIQPESHQLFVGVIPTPPLHWPDLEVIINGGAKPADAPNP